MQVQARSDLRMLKALVGVMGVLIVLGTAVVAGTIVHRVYANAQRPSMASAVVSPPAGLAPPVAEPVVLPAGAHISGIAAAGSDVAVWITAPAGDQLWLLNPQTGAHFVVITGSAVTK
jgi:hypothetical protein